MYRYIYIYVDNLWFFHDRNLSDFYTEPGLTGEGGSKCPLLGYRGVISPQRPQQDPSRYIKICRTCDMSNQEHSMNVSRVNYVAVDIFDLLHHKSTFSKNSCTVMIFQASKNDIAWPIVPASFHFQSPVSIFFNGCRFRKRRPLASSQFVPTISMRPLTKKIFANTKPLEQPPIRHAFFATKVGRWMCWSIVDWSVGVSLFENLGSDFSASPSAWIVCICLSWCHPAYMLLKLRWCYIMPDGWVFLGENDQIQDYHMIRLGWWNWNGVSYQSDNYRNNHQKDRTNAIACKVWAIFTPQKGCCSSFDYLVIFSHPTPRKKKKKLLMAGQSCTKTSPSMGFFLPLGLASTTASFALVATLVPSSNFGSKGSRRVKNWGQKTSCVSWFWHSWKYPLAI